MTDLLLFRVVCGRVRKAIGDHVAKSPNESPLSIVRKAPFGTPPHVFHPQNTYTKAKTLSLSLETLRLLEETLARRLHPRRPSLLRRRRLLLQLPLSFSFCPTGTPYSSAICLTSLVNSDVPGGCSDRGGAKSGQIEGRSGALVSPCRLEVQICKKGVCGYVRSLSRHVRCSMSPPVQGNSGVPLWRHTKARAEDGCSLRLVRRSRSSGSRRRVMTDLLVFRVVCGRVRRAIGSGLIVNEAMASTRFSSYETAVLKLSDTWRVAKSPNESPLSIVRKAPFGNPSAAAPPPASESLAASEAPLSSNSLSFSFCHTGTPYSTAIYLTSLVNSDVPGGCSGRGGAKSGQIEGGSGASAS
ncbi:hypothetical protein F2Q68_00003640 [Brassica cretica]|uniref:Uncharacterized protein n=1 Tax=Brassica cretica TaxID=69181 RepID=A0A8S9J8T9_BRACR|nr:hypothetical protein F2Q68_00003640 [Brassica cretica]